MPLAKVLSGHKINLFLNQQIYVQSLTLFVTQEKVFFIQKPPPSVRTIFICYSLQWGEWCQAVRPDDKIIWPCRSSNEISLTGIKICQNRSKILLHKKLGTHKISEYFKNLSKWRNFAKSGHSDAKKAFQSVENFAISVRERSNTICVSFLPFSHHQHQTEQVP